MHLIEHGKVLSALCRSKLLLKMKLTAFFVMLLCMQVSAKTFSQKISVNAKDITLEKFLHLVEAQSGYGIVYPDEIVEKTKLVSVQAQDKPLEEVLNAALKPHGLTWVLKNHTIIVRRAKPAPVNVTEQLQQQTMAMQASFENHEISGVITDAKGAPLAGVSVQLKGIAKGTVTNDRGAYTLKGVPAGTYKMLVSLIGFLAIEKTVVVNQPVVENITLTASFNQLDETVIIAYGSTTKRLNTGAVSSLGTDAIAKQTISNPLTALQGRIAGVQVTQDNGLAGGGVRLQIRGQGTAGAGFIPLYVIDGVPFTLFNGGSPASDGLNAYGLSGANGSISPFSMINPDDIERIDVLKDADATAIYGSRGANGVVLITTKKGAKDRTAFTLNFYQGIGKVNRYIDMMDTKEYLAMRKEGFAKAGITPTTSNAKDLTVWDPNAYTDWQKWAIGGTADITHANLGISGGNAQNSFLFNTTYHREGTVFPGSYSTSNYSARLSAGHSSADSKFNIRFSSSYSYMGNNLPITDLSSLYTLAPNMPLYNTDGSLNWDQTNPLSYLMKTNKARTDNFMASATVSYRLLSNLVLRANLGYTNTRLKQTNTIPARSVNSTTTTSNQLSYADNTNDNYIVEPQAEFTPKLGPGKLQLLAGSTFQQTKASGVSLSGVGFASEALLNNISSAATITSNSSNYSLYKYTGVFGRANYNLYNKYLLDVTFRRDGSSRFGSGHRFGNFGAVGAAWVFTEESFMKDIHFLSFGKLRAGYGLTGNDQIINYQYMDTYSSGGSFYNYVGSSVLVPGNIQNTDLHWETNKKLDVALELGFFKDRVLFKANYYRNRSSNQLVYVPASAQTGVTSYLGNLNALVQNKGVEFELTATPVSTKTVKWDVTVNMAINNNKLLEFPGLAYSSYATTYKLGYPVTLLQLYQYAGPDAATGAPTFTDVDKDGSVTFNNDRKPAYIGTPYFGGISSTLSWKSFTFDVAFQFNHRYGYKNSTLVNNSSPYGYGYTNHTKEVLNRWHAAGDQGVNLLPAANANYSALYYNYATSDANWGDASFIKFKTLSITYALPGNTLKKAGITGASVFVRGQNLFVWAKQKYTYDPETTLPGTGAGLGVGTYIAFPQLRMLTVGFNLSF